LLLFKKLSNAELIETTRRTGMNHPELFENDPLRIEGKKTKEYPEEADPPRRENAPSNANRYTERKKEDP
jgi:hypothetical protein